MWQKMLLLLFACFLVAESRKQFSLPQGPGPDGSRLITLYQCEGEVVKLTCSTGSINIVRANFGRFSIAVCNQNGNTNWTTDCASPAAAQVIKKMCESLQRCVVSVRADTLGDACPLTPKYLEVHYYCKENPELPAHRHLPQFSDTQLTALWNQDSHKVSLDSVLQAMKEQEEPVYTPTRVPITSSSQSAAPALHIAQTRLRGTSAKEKEELRVRAEVNTSGPTERSRPGDSVAWTDSETPQSESDSVFVLEVITYAVASVCGVILLSLLVKFGSSSSRFPCSCQKLGDSGYAESGSCKDGDSPGADKMSVNSHRINSAVNQQCLEPESDTLHARALHAGDSNSDPSCFSPQRTSVRRYRGPDHSLEGVSGGGPHFLTGSPSTGAYANIGPGVGSRTASGLVYLSRPQPLPNQPLGIGSDV